MNTVTLPGFCLTLNSPKQQNARHFGNRRQKELGNLCNWQSFNVSKCMMTHARGTLNQHQSQTTQAIWERYFGLFNSTERCIQGTTLKTVIKRGIQKRHEQISSLPPLFQRGPDLMRGTCTLQGQVSHCYARL